MILTVLAFLGCAYLACVLCVSGTSKLLYRKHFAGSMLAHRILPECVVPLMSFVVPVAEIAMTFEVVWMPYLGGITAAGAFCAFGFYRLALLLRTPNSSCGCFGPSFNEPASRSTTMAVFMQAGIGAFVAYIAVTGSDFSYSSRLILSLLIVAFIVYSAIALRRQQWRDARHNTVARR